MKKRIGNILTVLGLIAFVMWAGVSIGMLAHYDADIGGHIELAGMAESPADAANELSLALRGMDDAGLTVQESGKAYTSVVVNTPDEDIGFWRRNVEHAYIDLASLPLDADRVAVATSMMKARGSIAVPHESHIHAIDPDGISKYPHNTMMTIWGWLSVILAVVGFAIHEQDPWG